MKDYSKSDIWNTDETSLFYQDLGRSTFAPRDHVGRLVQNEKKRITALLYVDANGTIPNRPAMIDFSFPTGSKAEMKKEIRKETQRTVKGKKNGKIRMRQFKDSGSH